MRKFIYLLKTNVKELVLLLVLPFICGLFICGIPLLSLPIVLSYLVFILYLYIAIKLFKRIQIFRTFFYPYTFIWSLFFMMIISEYFWRNIHYLYFIYIYVWMILCIVLCIFGLIQDIISFKNVKIESNYKIRFNINLKKYLSIDNYKKFFLVTVSNIKLFLNQLLHLLNKNKKHLVITVIICSLYLYYAHHIVEPYIEKYNLFYSNISNIEFVIAIKYIFLVYPTLITISYILIKICRIIQNFKWIFYPLSFCIILYMLYHSVIVLNFGWLILGSLYPIWLIILTTLILYGIFSDEKILKNIDITKFK